MNIWDYAWGPVAGTPQPKGSLTDILGSSFKKATLASTNPLDVFTSNPKATERAFKTAVLWTSNPLAVFTEKSIPDIGGSTQQNPIWKTTTLTVNNIVQNTPLAEISNISDWFKKYGSWILICGGVLIALYFGSKIIGGKK